MKQFVFTAQELFCMAVLAQKHKMYGIPNPFAANHQVQMQAVMDVLLDSGIASMDIDGNLSLLEDYHEIMDFVCDCNAGVTISSWQEDKQIGYVLWRCGDNFLMAERFDGKYLFSKADFTLIRAVFDSLMLREQVNSLHSETVVPQLALKIAQRLCADGLEEDAVRVLRQYGVQERIALAIAAGFSSKAQSVRVAFMNPVAETQETVELAYLHYMEVCLKLGQTVQNLRTCAVFTETDTVEINQSVMEISAAFMLQ